METMSRGGASLPTSLSGGGLAHISAEVRSEVTEEDCFPHNMSRFFSFKELEQLVKGQFTR